MNKTYMARPEEVEPKWWLVDAQDKVVGRLASDIAVILMGKHRPTYTPHVDTGDYVIVVNAGRVHVSGNKEIEKIYYRHSGFPGGLRAETLSEVRKSHPERLVEIAVRGMLPKTKLGRAMFLKLKVYTGPKHPHQAQKPQPLNL